MASRRAKDDRPPSCIYENSLPQGRQEIDLSHITTNDSWQREDDVEYDNEEHYETVCENTFVNNPLPQPFDRKGDSTKQPFDRKGDSSKQPFDRKGDSTKQPFDRKQETMLRSEVAHPSISSRMAIAAAVVGVVLVLAVIGLTITGVIMYRTLNAKIEESERHRQTQHAQDVVWIKQMVSLRANDSDAFDIIQNTNMRMGSLYSFVQELSNRSDTSMDHVQLEIKNLKSELSIINPKALPADMDCTFDVDTCGWQQSTTDMFNWTRLTGPTKSDDTGPNSDHTSGHGYYLYTEASNPRSLGDCAVLISPTLPSDQDLCLQLYTNMYGNNMGQIVIGGSKSCGGTTMLAQYTTNDSSAIWRERNIDIPAQTSAFTVQFTGTRGSGYRSDAAIDDVTIKRGKC